jgi:WD40 repeat protein
LTLPPSGVPAEALREFPSVAGYELLAELGRGGMGVVYKARQKSLNRLVALKMVLAGGHASATELARFRAEAEAVARLQHPNIVQIHEVGESEGRPFFSLEFVAGGSLSSRLDGTPLPPRYAAQLVETLARAMDTAHQAGIVHRDLKPANILLASSGSKVPGASALPGDSHPPLAEWVPKITDFGLAKQLDSVVGHTQTGAVLGTPSYMAPEQAAGKTKEIGCATDVYALGAILYELLTGRPPFRAALPIDTILQVVNDDPVPPRRLQPRLPRDLETICLKCLEKSPAKRYGSAAELADDLERWANVQPIRARRIGRLGRASRWVQRNPVLASVCAASAAVIVVLSAFFYVRLLNENAQTHDALGQVEIERDEARRARDATDAANEEARDNLAFSMYEQAWALMLSHKSGRRWQALDLLQKAEALHSRERQGPADPAAAKRPPTKAQLRRAVAYALLLEDARLVRQVSLAAVPGFTRDVNPEGTRASALWMNFGGDESLDQRSVGLRLFDLTDGKILHQVDKPDLPNLTFRVSPDGQLIAFPAADQHLELWRWPSGEPRRPLLRPGARQPASEPTESTAQRPAFSADNRYVVGVWTEPKQTRLFLWDRASPAASRSLPSASAPVATAEFRSDSHALAYPVGGKRIAILNADDTNDPQIHELPLPVAEVSPWNNTSPATQIAWSPTEPLLAALCVPAPGKGTIILWDTVKRAERARWEGEFDAVRFRMAFSRDGKRLAASGKNGAIRCFDVPNQRECLRLDGAHADEISLLAWDDAGRLLSAGELNTINAWEPASAGFRSTFVPGRGDVLGFAFSPDGRWLASWLGGPQSRVVLTDRVDGSVAHELAAPAPMRDQQDALLFRTDSRQLAWVGAAESIIWDVATGAEVVRRNAPKEIQLEWFLPAFLADGRLLRVEGRAAAQDGRPEGLIIRDAASGREVGPGIDTPLSNVLGKRGVGRVEFSKDGRLLLGLPHQSPPSKQPLSLWDVGSGSDLGDLWPAEDEVPSLTRASLSADGTWLVKICLPASYDADVGPAQPRVSVWNVSGRRRQWEIRRDVIPKAWTFNPDGRLLALGFRNGIVEVWDVERGEELFRWQPRGDRDVKRLAFTPDGGTLASSDGGPAIDLLNVSELRGQLAKVNLDW